MAVEQSHDGIYRVGKMTFATADEAIAFDKAAQLNDGPKTGFQPYSNAMPTKGPRSTFGPARSFVPVAAFLALSVALMIGAGLFFGPHWTVYRMKAAIEAKDAEAFASYVDFPALKESVKAQLTTKMGQLLKSDAMKDNPFAGLGQMVGAGMINQLVDTLVSPVGVMLMMEQGKVATPPFPPAKALTDPKPAPNFAINYLGFSTAEIRSRDSVAGRFFLRRDGLFGWKLAAVDIPI